MNPNMFNFVFEFLSGSTWKIIIVKEQAFEKTRKQNLIIARITRTLRMWIMQDSDVYERENTVPGVTTITDGMVFDVSISRI